MTTLVGDQLYLWLEPVLLPVNVNIGVVEMTGIALNCSLVLWTNPVYKTSWASAASQQLVLVQVSMWRSFMIGVIKFSKADANRTLFFWCCIMVISYFIHVNKLLITAHPIRNLQTPASAEMNRRGVLQQVSLTLSSQSPPFFPSSQSPTPIDPCYAG